MDARSLTPRSAWSPRSVPYRTTGWLRALRTLGLIALVGVPAACGGMRQAEPDEPEVPADAGERNGEVAEAHRANTEHLEQAATDYVPADAEFMRDMIVHHGQALDMAALVPDRTDTEAMHLLARRIAETQEFEIGLMRDWLEERGEPLAEPKMAHETDGDPHAGMAGMASLEEMAALAESRDEAFERMFLELMIHHHEGALVMVEDLLEHEGAGLQAELYVLLSHVDADQRAEIARMRQMLESMD